MSYKIKWTISLLIILTFPFKIFSQVQNTIAKFIITNANENGKNISETLINNDSFTVFYTIKGDERMQMANVWKKSNTQSYGPTYLYSDETINETDKNYETYIMKFNWDYYNSYDNKKGTSKVQLIKIHKPQGITFSLKIITESLDVIEYNGFMEGTLNFSELNK